MSTVHCPLSIAALLLLLSAVVARPFLSETPYATSSFGRNARAGDIISHERSEASRVTFAVALLTAAACWAAAGALRGRLEIRLPALGAMGLAFAALALVSALRASDKRAALDGWLEQVSLLAAGFLVTGCPSAAGMPAIDIIDFEYGSAGGQNDYWHTPQDTVDKLSIQSLGIVGRTVLRLLDDLMIKQKPHCK